MAEGGVAVRATRRTVGEAGPEAIIPLHRLGDISRKMGGRGGLTVNFGSIGGGVDPDQLGAIVGRVVAAKAREDGGFKASIRSAVSGLF